MLSVHLFNLTGYPVLFRYFIHRADAALAVQLDKQIYNESELIEVKVALHAPYLSMNTNYERYEGKAEVNGVHYNFVKRKVTQDTLYMLCIPNAKATDLLSAENKYGKQVNDIPGSTKEKESSIKKGSHCFQYHELATDYHFEAIGIPVEQEKYYRNSLLPQSFITRLYQPPDQAFLTIS